MTKDEIATQRMRLLQALDQKDQAQTVVERLTLEIAQLRGVIAAMEHAAKESETKVQKDDN